MTTTATTTSPVSGLTEEQQAFVEAIRDFAQRECGTAEQRERLTDNYPELHNHELVARLGELGWLGASVPEEYGGIGGGMVDACLFLEEGFRGLLPMGGYPVTLITAGAVEKFGSAEQKQQVIGGMCEGKVSAIAMSEPEAGSDVGNLSCRAERSAGNDGGYVLNGQKTWISAAHLAEQILVIVRTDRSGSKHEGLTMFLVPADSEGLEINPIETMGGKETNDLFFTDCYLDHSAVVGEVGGGWTQLMSGLNIERLIVAANAMGVAQRAFDDVLAYIKERKQFDRPIGSFQTIKHRIADLATEIEATRLLVYDVARKVDAAPQQMLPREASMTKLKATQLAKDVSLAGMQMMGGYGYATEYDMERHVRAALVMPIYAGTNEIQREIISKTYGL
jgi:alkylation response protein AidB-like acyl-CoA dehydrogenase